MKPGDRIIPAYAGSTACGYPNACSGTGSSPHTRGALVVADTLLENLKDHPRIRGEHEHGPIQIEASEGSSPHTRGAPAHLQLGIFLARIIPAYAGSTPAGRRPRRDRPDHPRIRGEHCQAILHVSSLAGSSPHTRGAPRNVSHITPSARIIPAYAGSTDTRCHADPRPADHPRIRGEHIDTDRPGATGAGSSPHTRGARRKYQQDKAWRWIIPAYAGSTEMRRWPARA